VRRILDRLQSLGIAVFAVDITRATFGVPAVRVVAPALQLEPMGLATERLDRTIAETGGASAYTGAIPLI
jgi:ribosomal protein S12 methylthiotransferase accessory factor